MINQNLWPRGCVLAILLFCTLGLSHQLLAQEAGQPPLRRHHKPNRLPHKPKPNPRIIPEPSKTNPLQIPDLPRMTEFSLRCPTF